MFWNDNSCYQSHVAKDLKACQVRVASLRNRVTSMTGQANSANRGLDLICCSASLMLHGAMDMLDSSRKLLCERSREDCSDMSSLVEELRPFPRFDKK